MLPSTRLRACKPAQIAFLLPRDVKELVPDYLEECRDRGILQVRIIHGKGVGVVRRMVHAALDRLDFVESYRLGGHGSGSWGATLVELHPPKSGN